MALVRLTGQQSVYVDDTRRELLWRDGNQIGKSYAIAYFLLRFALRQHVLSQRYRGVLWIGVVGYSYAQMDPLLSKIWALAPKDRLDPKVKYQPKAGFTGYKNQHLRIYDTAEHAQASARKRRKDDAFDVDEQEAGLVAVIVIGTYQAGSQAIMGDSWHLAVLDEPPPETVVGEVQSRLAFHHGILRIGFTPTPSSPPLGYLKDMVDKGQLPEINFGVSEEVCTPRGSRLVDLPFRTQAEIDEWAGKLLLHERGMRIRGDWFPLLEGAWLSLFGDHNVRPFDFGDGVGPPVGAKLGLGIDYGIQAGKQAAVLFAVIQEWSLEPKCWWIDERASNGFTTDEQDARDILDMLEANLGEMARAAGVHPFDLVDTIVGDWPATSRAHGPKRKKGNAQTRKWLAKLLNRPLEDVPWIAKPDKPTDSVPDQCRMMNGVFGKRYESGIPHGLVHPRCKRFIQGCKLWRGDPYDPVKDVLDGGRYIFGAMVGGQDYMGQIVRYTPAVRRSHAR
jgi:hypothetical protein